MLRAAMLVLATVLGTSALGSYQSPTVEERVSALEEWKLSAEERIQSLENRLKGEGPSSTALAADASESVLSVAVTNKEFTPSNARSGQHEDLLFWDAAYTGGGIEKPARSIKGLLKFCDLFGDMRFQVRVTIDKPVTPNGVTKSEGVGIKYNQFLDDHRWLRTTDLENMTFRFQVEAILYQDGSTEKFGS